MSSIHQGKSACSLAALLVLCGCGAAVPRELVDARGAVSRASAGPTAATNPAGLHTAKQTLVAAEHYYEEEGDTQDTRDLAYTAERRAQTAEVRGRALAWSMEAERAEKEMREAEAARLNATSQELAQAKSQLKTQEQQLADERARRADAERRAAEAAEMLAKFATVKQESRGMVITLSGNVLFETNKAKLFPNAEVKLNEVAKALTQQDPDSQIIVEGHADSQGDDQHNLELSRARAESVREYLVAHGIAADRIVAKGYGETRPIADNKSAEGRANNRRVEIIVQGASAAGAEPAADAPAPQPTTAAQTNTATPSNTAAQSNTSAPSNTAAQSNTAARPLTAAPTTPAAAKPTAPPSAIQ